MYSESWFGRRVVVLYGVGICAMAGQGCGQQLERHSQSPACSGACSAASDYLVLTGVRISQPSPEVAIDAVDRAELMLDARLVNISESEAEVVAADIDDILYNAILVASDKREYVLRPSRRPRIPWGPMPLIGPIPSGGCYEIDWRWSTQYSWAIRIGIDQYEYRFPPRGPAVLFVQMPSVRAYRERDHTTWPTRMPVMVP